MLRDVLGRLLNRGELLGVLVADLQAELLFEGHDQLDDIQRIRSEIVDETDLLDRLDEQFIQAVEGFLERYPS